MRKLLLFLIFLSIFAQESLCLPSADQLFRDLETVSVIDKAINDKLPLVINYQLQGGYFTMPSARTYDAGTFGFGFAYVNPYNLWSLGFQFFDHLETTGNYWIYNGMLDGAFGHLGFGDSAERAANAKFILLRKEDGFPFLPDFAIGFNDFLGTCRFNSFYVAATQEVLPYNFEATLGWGNGRINGFFGGLAWTPFHRSSTLLKDLTFIAEYDANDYMNHHHEHPLGKHVDSRINVGAQYMLADLFRLSASTLRGNTWAASAALTYNLGESKGIIPKIHDPLPYKAPIDTEPIGPLRSKSELATDLAYAFQEQGFDLYNLYLLPDKGGKDRLWLKVINVRYREEDEVRRRIQHVLGALVPSNITTSTVVIEADGVDIHEYSYRTEDLQRYAANLLGEEEFRIIAPAREADHIPSRYDGSLLYKKDKRIWLLTFRPWLRTFMGSSSGKIKYETGLLLNPEGYLFNEIYYNLSMTYTIASSTSGIQSSDFLNPSRIINVRTDTILYNHGNSFHVDQAYIQKSFNMGEGWFARLAGGYFETAYAGAALEALYYPVNADWALGFTSAVLGKRSYYGFGFQKVRLLTDEGFIYIPYTGFQYFVDFYYQYRPFNLDFKFSAGQFLARDKGLRIDAGRTFLSGLRVALWYTFTNANDMVNGSRYYDKGFSITLPLDFFLPKSSRTRIGYGMSAWLRDCGAIANTGKQLYPTLFWERFNGKPVLY